MHLTKLVSKSSGTSFLLKFKDISFKDYAREYGVDDLSLLGWTDFI